MLKLFRAKIQLILASILILGSAPVARADVYMSMFNSANTAAINISNTIGLNAALKNSVKKGGSTRVSTKTSTRPTASLASLSYRPSASLSNQLRERFWNQIKADNPQAATEIDTALKFQDVVGQFNKDVAPFGLRSDNVGDSFTAYWIVMWMVANQEPIPSLDKVKAARAQISNVILNNPSISQGNDARKQTISETLIYETMMAISMNNQFNKIGPPSRVKALADQAHQNMLRRGVDMRSFQLTSTGFVAR